MNFIDVLKIYNAAFLVRRFAISSSCLCPVPKGEEDSTLWIGRKGSATEHGSRYTFRVVRCCGFSAGNYSSA